MQRVIDEMAKAKGDVERRYRDMLPEIIRECMAFAYLGKSFRFDANPDLERRVNQRLVELGDEILADIESRAKTAIKYAEDEEDEDAILAYMSREQYGEDLITRIDKHNSNFRYFLEGWLAIGMVNGLSQSNIANSILSHMENPYVSPLWREAFSEGYLSDAIRTQGYHFGRGNLRNAISALTELARNSVNEAFQYGRFLKYQKDGAIGYTIHRGSSFDCPYCDSFTGIVHSFDVCLLPLHPRCMCYSKKVMPGEEIDGFTVNNLALYRRNLQEYKRLKNDPNYTGVKQGKKNAAVTGKHLKHKTRNTGTKYFNNTLTSSQLEEECQKECARMGHSLILENEKHQDNFGNFVSCLDASADWVRADIKSIIGNGKNTIANSIKDKNAQLVKFNKAFPSEATDATILYFHDPELYSPQRVKDGYRSAQYSNGKKISLSIKRVICVVRGEEDWIEYIFK